MPRMQEGPSIELQHKTVTPRARMMGSTTPSGSWLWARPQDVVVETENATRVIPIPDPTRVVVLICAALSALAMLSMVFVRRPSSKEKGS